MSSSFLDATRSCVSMCVILMFLHGQLGLGLGSERLVPGEQQQSPTPNPPQPGELPQTPTDSSQTTVVQVPVPKAAGLALAVLDGEGASNIVGKRSATKTLVEVRDERNQLVEGAVVNFIAPADGPSVVFANGLRTATVLTDATGVARAPSMRAVNSGSFRLQVSASFHGQTVNQSISQTNYDSAAEANGGPAPEAGKPATANKGKGGLSGTTLALIIGAGAAAAVGIGVGLGHKGSSSSSTTTTSATIGGAGSPTVGAP